MTSFKFRLKIDFTFVTKEKLLRLEKNVHIRVYFDESNKQRGNPVYDFISKFTMTSILHNLENFDVQVDFEETHTSKFEWNFPQKKPMFKFTKFYLDIDLNMSIINLVCSDEFRKWCKWNFHFLLYSNPKSMQMFFSLIHPELKIHKQCVFYSISKKILKLFYLIEKEMVLKQLAFLKD